MQEIEFDVLSQVLEQLKQLLQDRALTLSSIPDLSPLCQLLSGLADEKSPRLQKLRNSTKPRSKLDPSSLVYPVLTILTSYPGHLDRAAQVSVNFTLCHNTYVQWTPSNLDPWNVTSLYSGIGNRSTVHDLIVSLYKEAASHSRDWGCHQWHMS